jgi:hypothetical protein
MRVRVVKSFIDKHTKEICYIGQEIDITQERFEELTSTALGFFVEPLDPSEVPSKKKPTAKKSKK